MPTRSLLALIDYVIRGVEHNIRVGNRKTPPMNTKIPMHEPKSVEELGKSVDHFSQHLALNPRTMDVYVEDLYDIMKSFGMELDEARALLSIAYDVELARMGKALDPRMREGIERILKSMKYPEEVMPRRDRLRYVIEKLRILKKMGIVDRNLEKESLKHAKKLESVLLRVRCEDLLSILRNLAFNSNSVKEYLEKVRIVLNIAREAGIVSCEKVRELIPAIDKMVSSLSKPSEVSSGVAPIELAREVSRALGILVPFYEAIARKYSYKVSLPPARRVNPVDTYDRDRWKPWSDDVPSLDIVESFIKGGGKFIWGVTTIKRDVFFVKSFKEHLSRDVKVAVSIDVSGSTGMLTGMFKNVIEYELVIALAIYNYAYRTRSPFILHIWSDRDELLEFNSFHRDTDVRNIARAFQKLSGGGTLASYVVKRLKEHPDWLWIVLSDYEWTSEDIRQFRREISSRSELTYALIIEHSLNYRVMYYGGTIAYCNYYPDSEVCKLLKTNRRNVIVRVYNVEAELDKVVLDVLKVFRETAMRSSRNSHRGQQCI